MTPNQVCQLAYLMIWPGRVVGRNHYFSVDGVERHAYDVHRLSRERLKRLSCGRSFADCSQDVYEDFRIAQRVAGHNVEFDIKHLSMEFERSGVLWRPKNTLCTMKFFDHSVGATNRKGKHKAPNLAELCLFLGVKTQRIQQAAQDLFLQSGCAHDARYDAAAVWLCLDAAQKMGQIRGLFGR